MAVLTEKQIKYSFDYYHKDEKQLKSVVEVSEYDSEDRLKTILPKIKNAFYRSGVVF